MGSYAKLYSYTGWFNSCNMQILYSVRLAVYCVLFVLSQPTGSLSFYQEVHDLMIQYSSDASKLYNYLVWLHVVSCCVCYICRCHLHLTSPCTWWSIWLFKLSTGSWSFYRYVLSSKWWTITGHFPLYVWIKSNLVGHIYCTFSIDS